MTPKNDDLKTTTLLKEHRGIKVPTQNNPLLKKTLDRVNNNKEITTLWKVINVHAIDRLKMTDHGPVHFQIVANIALKFLRILRKRGVKPSIVTDFELTHDHAEVVVLLASLLHDIGMSVNRDDHEEFSIFLTNQILREMLNFMEIEERTIVISEVLHAIINHRKKGKPSTIEAGIVRVADALDMTQGRSRISFEMGKINIYSLSAFAIDEVKIEEGKPDENPIVINIYMNNSSGLFQVDELLKRKLIGSGIEKYLEIEAYVTGETEKKLVTEFKVE